MTLEQYTESFMTNILDYKKSLVKLQEWNPTSQTVSKMIEKVDDEYLCSNNFEGLSVQDFLQNEWIGFQMALAHKCSEVFYGENYVMRFIEYMDFRDMMESCLLDEMSDLSVYTRIVNRLNIPTSSIPTKFLQALFSSDEFMYATNFLLKVIHKQLDNPDNYMTIDAYREHVYKHAEKAISDLQNEGYFGTYEINYLVEIMIAYRIGFSAISPLYVSTKIAKNPNKYEDLKDYVYKLWEQYRNKQQGERDIPLS